MTQQTKPAAAAIVARPVQQPASGAKAPLAQILPDREPKYMKLNANELKASVENKKVRRAAVQEQLVRIDGKIAEREKRLSDLTKTST